MCHGRDLAKPCAILCHYTSKQLRQLLKIPLLSCTYFFVVVLFCFVRAIQQYTQGILHINKKINYILLIIIINLR